VYRDWGGFWGDFKKLVGDSSPFRVYRGGVVFGGF